MVTAIVLAAMEMGASVNAEGVEDLASMAAIEMLGVDSAQGYLLARPTTEPWDWAAWGTKDWRAVQDGRDQAKAQG
jgi:EAL domain-containing protein (putative c-di-GMP-specific phosphodiesterase class I)